MNPTASKLSLAASCCAWCTLPQQSFGGPAASLGSAFHEIAAEVINGEVELAAPPTWDYTDLAARYNLDSEQVQVLQRMAAGWREWWAVASIDESFDAEIPYAYDPTSDTSRVLPWHGHRDYSAALPHEFCGTADVVQRYGNTVVVTDWKTGQRQNVTLPAENRQLRFLALCAARAKDRDHAIVQLGWVDPEGDVFVESANLAPFDLAAIAGEMSALAAKLAGNPKPEPGPHCRWCPAVGACPASHMALAEIAPVPPPEPFRVVADVTAITGPDHAGWMLHRLRAVRAAAEVVEGALRAYADAHGGIPTGEGTVWQRREVPVERIHIDERAVEELKVVLPGALRYTTSKTAIKDAAREAKLPLKRTQDEVLALLRTLGAVEVTVTTKYEEK